MALSVFSPPSRLPSAAGWWLLVLCFGWMSTSLAAPAVRASSSPGTNAPLAAPPAMKVLPLASSPTTFALATAAPVGATPSPLLPPFLQQLPLDRGPQTLVDRRAVGSAALYFTCFGIYVVVALLFLIYWRWMRRDLPMLAVGLLSLLMAVHTAAISGSLVLILPDLVDPHLNGMIEAVSFLLLNGCIAFLIWAYFPEAFRPASADWMRILNWSVAGLAVVTSVLFALAAILFGDETAAYMLSASRWIMAVLMVVVVALALQAFERRSDVGAITVVGLALVVVGSIHDVLFAGGGPDDRPYLITFGVLGFVLLQSYAVIRRSAESTRMADLSSRRLRREVDARTKELRAATIAAEAANMAKTDFVTAVTHELRTPLSSMLGYTELLREEADLSARHVEFLNTVKLSGERLLKLVNDLLDLAKIEAGRVGMNLADVDVSKVTEEVRRQLYPLTAAKDLYLRTEVDSQEPVAVADADRLRQVLINLVSNSIKFTSEGGITLRVTDGELDGRGPAVRVEVRDTGTGISPDFIPRLFERFTREERADFDEPTGSGLGLTIARELIEHMGGELTVQSHVGEGSTFGVVLPRA